MTLKIGNTKHKRNKIKKANKNRWNVNSHSVGWRHQCSTDHKMQTVLNAVSIRELLACCWPSLMCSCISHGQLYTALSNVTIALCRWWHSWLPSFFQLMVYCFFLSSIYSEVKLKVSSNFNLKSYGINPIWLSH